MIWVALLFLLGLVLSAFFSGSETGFYRVTRVRLLIDAMTGDWTARGLLWATNHPAVFVATALVGNNLANYVSSLSVVMGTRLLFPHGGETVELVAPLLLAPVLFIYGELLPKHLFFEAPNRMLRWSSPGLLVAAVLFAPITAILWVFNRFLQLVVRQSPQVIELVLARRELSQLVDEGHEAGILKPTQQLLAQSTFALAGRPLGEFVVPEESYAHANLTMRPIEVLRLAHRQKQELILVEEASKEKRLLGYLRVADLALKQAKKLSNPMPLVTLQADSTYLSAVLRLLETDHALGHVVTNSGETIGFVTARQLTQHLLAGNE